MLRTGLRRNAQLLQKGEIFPDLVIELDCVALLQVNVAFD